MKAILLAFTVIAACVITLEAAADPDGGGGCRPEPEPIIQTT
jgi:hypothetical protein